MTLDDLISCCRYIKTNKLNGKAEVIVVNSKRNTYIGKPKKIKYSTEENKVVIHYE